MVEIPEHLRGHLTDSAGQPWAGRNFSDNPWQDDRGEAPESLLAAMRAFRAGEASPAKVVDALRDVRLLVPLVAELGEAGVNDRGQKVDKSADLSIVTVESPDGRGIVPVFSSVAAMKLWNPEARPVPVESRRAALAAVDAGSDLLILDAGSEATEFVVRRPAVWAIAQGHDYAEPWLDARVHEQVAKLLDLDTGISGINVLPGDPAARFAGPELQVVVELAASAAPERARILELVGRALSDNTELVALIDSLAIAATQTSSRDLGSDENTTQEADKQSRRFGLWRRKRR